MTYRHTVHTLSKPTRRTSTSTTYITLVYGHSILTAQEYWRTRHNVVLRASPPEALHFIVSPTATSKMSKIVKCSPKSQKITPPVGLDPAGLAYMGPYIVSGPFWPDLAPGSQCRVPCKNTAFLVRRDLRLNFTRKSRPTLRNILRLAYLYMISITVSFVFQITIHHGHLLG
jgi:hypothetical protein